MSSVIAVKAKLRELMEAAPALAGVRVTWAGPTEETDERRDMVWFGETEQTEEWGSLGAQQRTEDYAIDIVVQSYKAGDDPQISEQRAWDLAAEISRIVHNDPGVTELVKQYAEIAGTRMLTQVASPSGWRSVATLRFHATSRVYLS